MFGLHIGATFPPHLKGLRINFKQPNIIPPHTPLETIQQQRVFMLRINCNFPPIWHVTFSIILCMCSELSIYMCRMNQLKLLDKRAKKTDVSINHTYCLGPDISDKLRNHDSLRRMNSLNRRYGPKIKQSINIADFLQVEQAMELIEN